MRPSLLLDTHILVRWLFDAKRLTRNQSRALETAVQHLHPVGLSAMTLLEVATLSAEGKLELNSTLDEFFLELESSPKFHIFPLTCEVAGETAALLVLRDPADRAIVAAARVNRLKLVTSDQRIIESKLVPVID